jgi:hypothetical protein
MRLRRRLGVTTVTLALLSPLVWQLPATGTTGERRTTAATGAATPTFATPVVVDHYRPGYEPDLAVDRSPKGNHRVYVTWPFGFSTTQSFIARSDDQVRSFHLTEGNVFGKPSTCAGGGDTDTQVSPVDGTFYFADLQGLTNFSNSKSTNGGRTFTTTCTAVKGVGVDRQWLAIDTNGGTSSVAPGAAGGRIYFTYDNILQSTSPGHETQNQLVVNESDDGVNYGGGVGCGTVSGSCAAPAAVITAQENIPGDILVDNTPGGAYQHSIYVPHSNDTSNDFRISVCRGPAGPKTAAKVADYCTDSTSDGSAPAGTTSSSGRRTPASQSAHSQ